VKLKLITNKKLLKRSSQLYIIPIAIGLGLIKLLLISNNPVYEVIAMGIFTVVIGYLFLFRKFNITQNYILLSTNSITIFKNDQKKILELDQLNSLTFNLSSYDHGPKLTVFDLKEPEWRGNKNFLIVEQDETVFSYEFYLPNRNTTIKLLNTLYKWRSQHLPITINKDSQLLSS